MFLISEEEKYVKLEFGAIRNISKVIRILRSQFEKVPWKVPLYRAIKMMNGRSCNNFLVCVLRVFKPMAQPCSIICCHSMNPNPHITITD